MMVGTNNHYRKGKWKSPSEKLQKAFDGALVSAVKLALVLARKTDKIKAKKKKQEEKQMSTTFYETIHEEVVNAEGISFRQALEILESKARTDHEAKRVAEIARELLGMNMKNPGPEPEKLGSRLLDVETKS